jgi:hypothetical protein
VLQFENRPVDAPLNHSAFRADEIGEGTDHDLDALTKAKPIVMRLAIFRREPALQGFVDSTT